MSNYKDVDNISKEIEKLSEDIYDKKTIRRCLKLIEKAPLTDMQPIIYGKWEAKKSAYMADYSLYECSICHEYYVKHPYCPHCGAKMSEE